MSNQEFQAILKLRQSETTMKGRLRVMARGMGAWPVLGRFVRMVIALIRLPEERLQYQQRLSEQARQLKEQADALALIHERLARHDFFVASQIPKLASALAELRQTRKNTETMAAASIPPLSATATTPHPLSPKPSADAEVKHTLKI